jgi:hypothetical protein
LQGLQEVNARSGRKKYAQAKCRRGSDLESGLKTS